MHRVFVAAILATGMAWSGEKFTNQQLKARFYYDLGPAEVDVSSYPPRQRQNYRVFAKTCSQCHTLARPINSPIVARKDWTRLIQRMHWNTKARAKIFIPAKDVPAILDFLAYDSNLRKVEQKAEFKGKTKELIALFEKVKNERSRLQIEEDKKKIREPAPYVGVKPKP